MTLSRKQQLAALCASVALFCASPGWAEVADYPADKIGAHTYVIHGPTELPNKANGGFMNNPVIVETSDSLVIIDPGSSLQAGRMVLRQAKKISDKPVSHVFNTHIHGDHWLGNHAIEIAFPNAPIFAHPKMIRAAHEGEAESWVALMEQLTEGETKGTAAVIPNRELTNGQTMKIGGITFKFHLTDHTHTHTDAMIEIVEDKAIILGDNGFNKRIGRMDDGSFRGMLANCDVMLARDFDIYIPGHGPSGGKEAFQPFCDFLQILYAEAAAAVDDGAADFEVKDQAVEALANYKDWPGFEEEIGRQLSLAMLEYEQASFE